LCLAAQSKRFYQTHTLIQGAICQQPLSNIDAFFGIMVAI
jgi:hypothetical protein